MLGNEIKDVTLKALNEDLTKFLFEWDFLSYEEKGDTMTFLYKNHYDYCGDNFLAFLDITWRDCWGKKIEKPELSGYIKITNEYGKEKGKRFDSRVGMDELCSIALCYNIIDNIENKLIEQFHDQIIIKDKEEPAYKIRDTIL